MGPSNDLLYGGRYVCMCGYSMFILVLAVFIQNRSTYLIDDTVLSFQARYIMFNT